MVRVFYALLAAGAVFAAHPAFAQAPDQAEDGRYSFHRVEDGFLRLDSRSGQVSLCGRKTVGWGCQAVPDERVALESEIARLQGDNAALKKEILSHGLSLPSTIKG